jgi:ATP-dependent helicase/nuclease subunit A
MRLVRFFRHLPRGIAGCEKGGPGVTPSQCNAVRRTGQNVCVVAGPGSGKTRVLIERFAWLVEERNVPPSRILAITFTEKAATEIKQRLIARFSARPDLRESIERAWVSTIDGFCARLLRENAIAAGLAPDFKVLEEAAAERLARESADDALEEIFRDRPQPLRRVLESLDLSTQEDGRNPDLARGLLDVYGAMRIAQVEELPQPVQSDAWPRAAECAREVLADRFAAGASVATLREWAERFLALPLETGREHFLLLEMLDQVHLGRIGRNTPAVAAARELKNELAARLEQQWIARSNADLLVLLRQAVASIAARYRERKRRDGLLDFADLEEEAIRLLQADEAVRERTAARFDEILMDELQDTNWLQWRLVDLIRRQIFAVGDINQSIYGFRHAEPDVFEQYRDGLSRAGFAIDELRENHRSADPILEAVSRAFDGAAGMEARGLIGTRGGGPRAERMVATGADANNVEAGMIATRICELRAGGRNFRDIAILVRTMTAAGPIERALDRAGIPFVVSGGRTFLEAREIRDALALLAALANPLDEIALLGVLRSPLVGLGDEEIFCMGRDGRLAEFEKRFGELRSRAGFSAPDLLLATALDQCGYTAGLSERGQANIDKFLGLVRGHRQRTLVGVVEEMESLRALQSEAEAPPADAGDLVRLMSMHAAKGLEFPVVFVSALHRGPDARKPVIAFSATAGLGAKWRNPATGKGASDTAHAMIVEEMKRKERAEENRLLYVAMTRAQDLLILSHAERGRTSGWLDLVAKIPVTRSAGQIEDQHVALVAPAGRIGANFLDPPGVTGQYDSSAPATAIAMFHACPRKYLLSSVNIQNGQTKDGQRGTGAMALGLEVHRVLAGGEGSAEAVALAGRFHGSELGRRAARATRIEREFDFLLPIEDILVRGQIDLWFEESGELTVVDYKTDRDESLAEVYVPQVNLYALALERYVGRLPDRAALYFLRTDRKIEVRIDRNEAAKAVRSFRDAQENLKYRIRPGARCRRCAFFENRCPAQLSLTEGF